MFSFAFALPFNRYPASREKGATVGAVSSRRGSTGAAIARGLALFLGGFALINPLGELFIEHFDVSIWWIDLDPLTRYAEAPLLAAIGAALLAFGLRPAMGRGRRLATLALIGLALLATIVNGAIFYTLLAEGAFPSALPIPFSSLITLALALIARGIITSGHPRTPRPIITLATMCVSLVLFPLLQMFCFGKTDYRRPADAIVVLGAKAYADGTPSVPLADRVRTACDLFHQGLAPRLIFSGGPGDGAIHETESMRNYAMSLGVPESAIMLDRDGLNTQETVDHTIPLLHALGARRVMVVSHFYHLPRIKMTYQREGWNVYTVPANESYTLNAIPFYISREVAGLWMYYLRGAWR